MIYGHLTKVFLSLTPILVSVEKAVRLLCKQSGLIMSLPARTKNNSFRNLQTFCFTSVVLLRNVPRPI